MMFNFWAVHVVCTYTYLGLAVVSQTILNNNIGLNNFA